MSLILILLLGLGLLSAPLAAGVVGHSSRGDRGHHDRQWDPAGAGGRLPAGDHPAFVKTKASEAFVRTGMGSTEWAW